MKDKKNYKKIYAWLDKINKLDRAENEKKILKREELLENVQTAVIEAKDLGLIIDILESYPKDQFPILEKAVLNPNDFNADKSTLRYSWLSFIGERCEKIKDPAERKKYDEIVLSTKDPNCCRRSAQSLLILADKEKRNLTKEEVDMYHSFEKVVLEAENKQFDGESSEMVRQTYHYRKNHMYLLDFEEHKKIYLDRCKQLEEQNGSEWVKEQEREWKSFEDAYKKSFEAHANSSKETEGLNKGAEKTSNASESEEGQIS